MEQELIYNSEKESNLYLFQILESERENFYETVETVSDEKERIMEGRD